MELLDSDHDEPNLQNRRISVSASNIPNNMDYYNQVSLAASPMYGQYYAPGTFMNPVSPGAAYYNVPPGLVPSPSLYYNQAMTVPPVYYNNMGPTPYMTSGEANYENNFVQKELVENEKKEKVMKMLLTTLVIFFIGFLLVSSSKMGFFSFQLI